MAGEYNKTFTSFVGFRLFVVSGFRTRLDIWPQSERAASLLRAVTGSQELYQVIYCFYTFSFTPYQNFSLIFLFWKELP